MKCVHCGNELMPGSKFCTNCGTPVSEPVTPVPSPNTGSSQDPMGNWPASDFTAPPENSSPDSVAEEISAAGGSDPSASQSAPVYQESISQDSFSASGSAAQEAPSECGDIPSAVPPAGSPGTSGWNALRPLWPGRRPAARLSPKLRREHSSRLSPEQ